MQLKEVYVRGKGNCEKMISGNEEPEIVFEAGELEYISIPFLQGWNASSEDIKKRVLIVREELFPRIDELCTLIKTYF